MMEYEQMVEETWHKKLKADSESYYNFYEKGCILADVLEYLECDYNAILKVLNISEETRYRNLYDGASEELYDEVDYTLYFVDVVLHDQRYLYKLESPTVDITDFWRIFSKFDFGPENIEYVTVEDDTIVIRLRFDLGRGI